MSDFNAVAEAIIRARLKDDPVHATWTGVHDYDSELPDVTADGFAHSRNELKAHIATLAAYTPGDLTAGERLDHRLLTSMLEVELRELTELQPEKHDPSLYPSIAADAIYSILAHDYTPLAQRIAHLVARLQKIPALLKAGRDNLVRSPRVWTDIAIDETKGALEFFEATVDPLLREYAEAHAPLRAAGAALREYVRFLKDTHTARDGMSFAIGRELFDYKLTHEHFLPYTSETLLEFGAEAVRLTEIRLQEVAQLIERGATWAELVEQLRSEHPVQGELLEQYQRGVLQARDFVVDRGLITLPAGESLEVVETPLFLRPTIPYAAYMAPGMFETRQQGLYYVTPVDKDADDRERHEQMLGHNRFSMLMTNVHESYPGHHVQLVLANQAPSLVRRYFDSTVFAEGWALYCEQLVLDEGLSADPRARLFQLKDQLWRACRIVIDVKLSTGAMTVDEAVAMLVDVAKLEHVNAVGEVRRYTQSPTQPMSYLVGKQQIIELRDRQRRKLGNAFDLREFHDRLLSQGTIPVALIAESPAMERGAPSA